MTKRNIEKIFAIIGVALAVAIIITGICFIASPASSYSTDSGDEVKFGADFYTYMYDVTRIAARNAAVTANNLSEIGDVMAIYSGMFFIFSGLLAGLCSTKKLVLILAEENEEKKDEAFLLQLQEEISGEETEDTPEEIAEEVPAAEEETVEEKTEE